VGGNGEFMGLLGWGERRIRTVWRIEKEGRTSALVGTAHFSPYRFKKPLTKLIHPSETILFEGPLDSESMAKVAEYGRHGENTPSVYEALDPEAIQEINRQFSVRIANQTISRSYLEFIRPANPNFLEVHTRGVRPWMAFLTIWSTLLNWEYFMDMEAFAIAQKLGKKIRFLETIEDQLAALDGMPFERIVNYLNHAEKCKIHKDLFLKAFLKGEVEKFISLTGEFPTRCDSIIQKRDPIFFKRMKPFFDEGKAVAFVGVGHIPGMIQMFRDEGYKVYQETS
jgi:uncharacterized protein YbaP (TraB family)